MFKGYVTPEDFTGISLKYDANYIPTKGKNAGREQGPTLFLNPANKTKKTFTTASEAIKAAIGSGTLDPKTMVYANNEKMLVTKAAKLKLEPFQFLNEKYMTEPKWGLVFMTSTFKDVKNRQYLEGTAAKPKATGPAKAQKDRPLF